MDSLKILEFLAYLLDRLFVPIRIVVDYPLIALLPGLAFFVAFVVLRAGGRRHGLGWVLTAAVVWAVYTVYGCYMNLWSRTVHAPIRVDLLLVLPVLLLFTGCGLWGWVTAVRSGTRQAARTPRATRRPS